MTCAGWLERVDEDLESLRKSPFELEEFRKLSDEEAYIHEALYHLREAVMSLAMEVAHLKKINEIKDLVSAGGKSMGRKK